MLIFIALSVVPGHNSRKHISTIVSHKYAPPFAILALVQNVGGAYTRDAIISLAITPSLPGMKSLSVGGWGPSVERRRAQNGEMLKTLAVGWRALELRSEEAGHFREVAGVSIVDADGPCSL